MSELPSKLFWIAWSNTDTTEGRGWSYPLCISECRATAIRCGLRGGVMGTDCEVTPYNAMKIDGDWLAPFFNTPATPEDLKSDAAYIARRDAVAKCRAAGIDEKTIEDLTR